MEIQAGEHTVRFGDMCYDASTRMIPVPAEEPDYLALLARSFPFFLQELWLWSGLIRKWPLSFMEMDMAHFFQHGPKRRGVLAPRNVGKTMPLTCAGSLWAHYASPGEVRSLLISKTLGHTEKVIHTARGWMEEIQYLSHLLPDPGQRQSNRAFDVRQAGKSTHASYQAYGIMGQLTGAHGNLLIADDIETLENTKTVTARQQLAHSTSEFTAMVENNGHTVVIGTPHHFDSIYPELAKRGYTFRSWPLWVPGDSERAEVIGLSPIYDEAVARGLWKPGQCVFPHRYSPDKLIEIQNEPPSYQAMQYGLRFLDVSDHFPFRVADLIVPDFSLDRDRAPLFIKWGENAQGVSTAREDIACLGHSNDCVRRQILYDTNPDNWHEYNETILTVDPAGKGLDRIGYAAVSYLNGYLWVKAWGSMVGPVGPEQREKLIAIAYTHGATTILIESDFGQDAVAELMEASVAEYRVAAEGTWNAHVEAMKAPKYAKHERIVDTLEAWIANHRIVVDAKAIEQDKNLPREHEPQYQLAYIRREAGCIPHDDALDALSMAASYFRDRLTVSPEHMLAKITEERQAVARKAKFAALDYRGDLDNEKPWWYR